MYNFLSALKIMQGSRSLFSSISLLLLSLFALNTLSQSAYATSLQLTKISGASDVSKPVHAVSPKGDTERLFILDQRSGEIRIFDTNTKTFRPGTFLTVPNLGSGAEQGLLSMAFDPNFATSGKFFVSSVAGNGTHRVVEYKVSAGNLDIADATPTRTVLTVEHPNNTGRKHYGGWIDFSPTDGKLYVSVGDSGQEIVSPIAQQNDNKFGSILRIDPFTDAFPLDPDNNYSAPADNPFVNKAGDDAVYAYGLRNPWRPGFDPATGDLFIADVGENSIEEINIGISGANYGWPSFEGTQPLGNINLLTVPVSELVFPIHEYEHELGRRSITGGAVYRGSIAELFGRYFYADFLSGEIWSFLWNDNLKTVSDLINWTLTYDQAGLSLDLISSFGFDGNGEMYVLDLGGEVFQVTGATSAVPLPAALPLYGTGLAILGFIGWRRKQKNKSLRYT